GGATAFQFRPDGKLMATGAQDGTLQLWDTASGTSLVSVAWHGSAIHSLDWSRDGVSLATGSMGRSVRVYRLVWRPIATTRVPGGIASLAMDPGGSELAVAGADGELHFFEPRTGAAIRTDSRRPASVFTVTYSPDGRDVVESRDDGTIALAERGTGRVR